MSGQTSEIFETHFATLQLDDQTLELEPGETIVPESLLDAFNEPVGRLRSLPRLAVEASASTSPDLHILGTLGEGGMGIVQLANQLVLDRNVAVKTLRSVGDEHAPKLLQEAYVTGRLEHPNIIPIYTLGRDDAGAPLIVMKRVEGVSWLEVLEDPSCAPTEQPIDLVWHLEILLQVCNAVRYAHSHHVIHRDIKPENVMIGQFGEVYLLDWGIAVSIAEEAADAGWLPHRSMMKGLSGTPAYMAPELTNDDASEHDERTDVYLLGATLHHLMTGTPRHAGKTLFEVMRSAFESQPFDYPPEIPAELAALANRAMAKSPEDRFSEVDQFRQAIFDYLEHRTSHELTAEAAALLDRIEHVSEAGPEDTADLVAHDLFTECRFACLQALKAWPENPAAHELYVRYLTRNFRHALQRDDLLGAQSALAELEATDSKRPNLHAALDARAGELDSRKEEFEGLREFAAQLDLRRGRVSRSLSVLIMGVLWGATVFIAWLRIEMGVIPDDLERHVGSVWRSVGIGLLAVFLFRKPMFGTAGNRRLSYLILIVVASIAILRLIAYIHMDGLDVGTARSYETLVYAIAAGCAGLLADDLRISLFAIIYGALAVLEPWLGSFQLLGIAVSHTVFLAGVAFLWTPRQLEKRWSV